MGNTLAIGTFTVTPSVDSGRIKFTLTDTANQLTVTKMIRAVIGDAISQWLLTNAEQLLTNGVLVGNDAGDTIGGPDLSRPAGDGFDHFRWNYGGKYAHTPAITTTSLTTDALTVTAPYADVV